MTTSEYRTRDPLTQDPVTPMKNKALQAYDTMKMHLECKPHDQALRFDSSNLLRTKIGWRDEASVHRNILHHICAYRWMHKPVTQFPYHIYNLNSMNSMYDSMYEFVLSILFLPYASY